MRGKIPLNELYDVWKANDTVETKNAFGKALITYVERACRKQYKHGLQFVDDAIGIATGKIWGYLDTYNPAKGRLSTWVSTIVENLYNDEMNRIRKVAEDRIDTYLDLECDGGITKLDDKILCNELMSKLEPLDRALVKLKFWHGLTEKEMGERCGKDAKWIENRFARTIMPTLKRASHFPKIAGG